MAKHPPLRSTTVLTALLVAKSAVSCFGSNEASVVASSLSSVSLPKISVSPANTDGISRSNHSSWWHAFDGIPFLLERRKLIKAKAQNNGGSNDRMLNSLQEDNVDNFHRFLAFGDYADHSFQCPATTTCPIVCVATVDDCPQDGLCPGTHPDKTFDADHEYTLCADGTCADVTAGEACDDSLESACECEALPVMCAKQVDLFTNCESRFEEYYDSNSECLEKQAESIPQVSFTGPLFIACYVVLCAVTFLMLGWCAWNQRLAPVSGSTVPLEPLVNLSNSVVGVDKSNINEGWTQTAYKRNVVGMSIYALVIIVAIIFQILLLFLTVEYYVQQEAITTSFFGSQVFFDELQVLRAFEIVWMVGFVWCFFLKYPPSVHSLFLRRCLHDEATYVAVSAPVHSVDASYSTSWINGMQKIGACFHSVMSFLYSDTSQHPTEGSHQVTFCQVRVDRETGSRYFYFRMRRYIFDRETGRFVLGCWDVTNDTTIGQWMDKDFLYRGISSDEAIKRFGFVGPNVLDLKKPTILGSIIAEFAKPFYLYQNFMVWTWFPYWYYYMAIVNTVVRVTAGLVVGLFQYSSDMDLYRLMVTEGNVEVLRDGVMTTIDQLHIVPGDIVRLSPGVAYFDMVVLQGTSPLLDESALTGEVHPVAKRPLDPANAHLTYDPKVNKASTISAGTTILECGEGEGTKGDLAIVTQTGSFTAKGKLLSDVLSYERHKFKFDSEVMLVLAILAVEAAILLAVVFSVIKDNWEYSWFYAMFVLGTVFPPLLPSVFVVSVGISCRRLQRKRITCTDSRGILIAGKVKRAFFDKTGTLTNQGLDFLSAKNGTEFQSMHASIGSLSAGVTDPILKLGLATCHTLHASKSGALIGPAVDRMGFSAVSAKIQDEKSISFEGTTVTYLKRFEFDHHSMTQSVVISNGDESTVFVKGSPEAIAKLCVPSSLPSNFHEMARLSARNGLYQLAMATSPLKSAKSVSELKREDIERDLNFAGVINFQNSMKEDTPQVIKELREGDIISAMITGDNVLTGIYIAKKAGLIGQDENVVIGNTVNDGVIEWVNAADDSPASMPIVSESLALTGEVWQYLLSSDPNTALTLAPHTKVFGRCTPNDKVSIVTHFVEQGQTSLFCGDGGNDCGALKAAHVGIALSDAEASVVAPFTSLDKTITSVLDVLKEGRCALASALAAYKYMIMYGQVESINQVANAYLSITFTEWCWVFMDGIWTITMAFSLPLAEAAKKLSPKRPTASILGPHTMASACGILGINFLFLVIGLLALYSQDWFQCRKWGSTDVSNVLTIGDNYETSVIFIISGYQYIASAAAYNFGYTFRANWFKNYIFVFFFALWTALQFGATLSASNLSCIWRLNCDNDHAVRFVTGTEPEAIYNPWNTTVMPMGFRWILFVLMVVNLILVCAWDYFVVNKYTVLSRLFKLNPVPQDSQRADSYNPPKVEHVAYEKKTSIVSSNQMTMTSASTQDVV